MTDNSHSSLNEAVSALVDGEHNDLDMQRVLNALDGKGPASSEEQADTAELSTTVREAWIGYHRVSAVMRKDDVAFSHIDLSQAVSAAIAQETAPKQLWYVNAPQFFGKTAVAAAVTFGVVFGVQQYSGDLQPPQQSAPAIAAQEVKGAVVPQGFELPPLTARTVSTNNFAGSQNLGPLPAVAPVPQGRIVISNQQFQEQLNRMMFKHAEQSSASGNLGLMPYVRVSGSNDDTQD